MWWQTGHLSVRWRTYNIHDLHAYPARAGLTVGQFGPHQGLAQLLQRPAMSISAVPLMPDATVNRSACAICVAVIRPCPSSACGAVFSDRRRQVAGSHQLLVDELPDAHAAQLAAVARQLDAAERRMAGLRAVRWQRPHWPAVRGAPLLACAGRAGHAGFHSVHGVAGHRATRGRRNRGGSGSQRCRRVDRRPNRQNQRLPRRGHRRRRRQMSVRGRQAGVRLLRRPPRRRPARALGRRVSHE